MFLQIAAIDPVQQRISGERVGMMHARLVVGRCLTPPVVPEWCRRHCPPPAPSGVRSCPNRAAWVLSTLACACTAAQAANNRIPIFPYIVYSPIMRDAGMAMPG